MFLWFSGWDCRTGQALGRPPRDWVPTILATSYDLVQVFHFSFLLFVFWFLYFDSVNSALQPLHHEGPTQTGRLRQHDHPFAVRERSPLPRRDDLHHAVGQKDCGLVGHRWEGGYTPCPGWGSRSGSIIVRPIKEFHASAARSPASLSASVLAWSGVRATLVGTG